MIDIVQKALIVTFLIGLMAVLYFVVKFGSVILFIAAPVVFAVAAYKLLNWYSKKGLKS